MATRSIEELDQARQAFLSKLPPTYQGVACNYFLEVPRTMPVDAPQAVVNLVIQEVKARIERAQAHEHWSGRSLTNLKALDEAMRQDPAGALILAEWAIAYVALPEDQRQARKTQQRQVWATESMRGKPATPKQLDYLKTLGYVGEVIDRRHASDVINHLTRSRP